MFTLRECRRVPVKGPDSIPEVQCFCPLAMRRQVAAASVRTTGLEGCPAAFANTHRTYCARGQATHIAFRTKTQILRVETTCASISNVWNYGHGLNVQMRVRISKLHQPLLPLLSLQGARTSISALRSGAGAGPEVKRQGLRPWLHNFRWTL